MLGSTGPSVIDQTPSAPRAIFWGVLTAAPGRAHSPTTATSLARGARSRKVKRRSGWSSGDTRMSAAGGGAETGVGAAWAKKSRGTRSFTGALLAGVVQGGSGFETVTG